MIVTFTTKFLLYFISQNLTGNSDKSSVVVHWFTLPFAAQYVRILPKNYYNAQCMRVDLFGCKDCKWRVFSVVLGEFFNLSELLLLQLITSD